jgi:hypothetical protein
VVYCFLLRVILSALHRIGIQGVIQRHGRAAMLRAVLIVKVTRADLVGLLAECVGGGEHLQGEQGEHHSMATHGL